jgi:hypothetical protein
MYRPYTSSTSYLPLSSVPHQWPDHSIPTHAGSDNLRYRQTFWIRRCEHEDGGEYKKEAHQVIPTIYSHFFPQSQHSEVIITASSLKYNELISIHNTSALFLLPITVAG